ncbi:active regulator of SIRT1-like [Euwallacea fornicatus]|uniref:active regulator of SIRT1-like n=1 Tax=Euwallacea fornicatus TaxID=995702 RepID=UPI00338F9FC0
MSAAIVKKALELVDPEFCERKVSKRKNKSTSSSSLFPEKYKIGKFTSKANSFNLHPHNSKKYTIQEAKRELTYKSKAEILKRNLKKLEKIHRHSKVVLDKTTTKNIVERAVTRRPITTKPKKSKKKNSTFTEEDFKQFEEEYMNSED